MQLYSLASVEACEQEDGWKQAAAKSVMRCERGKMVTARYLECAKERTWRMYARHEEAS